MPIWGRMLILYAADLAHGPIDAAVWLKYVADLNMPPTLPYTWVNIVAMGALQLLPAQMTSLAPAFAISPPQFCIRASFPDRQPQEQQHRPSD